MDVHVTNTLRYIIKKDKYVIEEKCEIKLEIKKFLQAIQLQV